MNIFDGNSGLQIYAEKWQVKNSRSFSEAEKSSISKAEVVNSDYGLSVCFMLARGGRCYIPLSNQSMLGVGDTVNLDSAKLLTLGKSGEADIMRVDA